MFSHIMKQEIVAAIFILTVMYCIGYLVVLILKIILGI